MVWTYRHIHFCLGLAFEYEDSLGTSEDTAPTIDELYHFVQEDLVQDVSQ